MKKEDLYTDVTLALTSDYVDGVTYNVKNSDERLRFDYYDLRNNKCAKDMYGSIISGCEEYIKDIKEFDKFINSHKYWVIYLHRRRTNKNQIIGAYIDDNLVGYIAPQLYDFIAPFFRGKGVAVVRIIKGIYNNDDGKYYIVVGYRQEDELSLEESLTHDDYYWKMYNPLPIIDDVFELSHNVYYYSLIGEIAPEDEFAKMYNHESKDINTKKIGKNISVRTPFIKNIEDDFDIVLYREMIEECPEKLPPNAYEIEDTHLKIKENNEKEMKRILKILIENK